MNDMDKYVDKAKFYWDLFVVEVKALGDDLYHWITNLSHEERLIGICLFILVLIYMIFSRQIRKNTNPGTGRQFTGALILVMLFAFGVGWNFDFQAGSLSHLFKI